MLIFSSLSSRPVDHAGGSSLKLDDEEFSLTDSIPQLDGSGDMPRKGYCNDLNY